MELTKSLAKQIGRGNFIPDGPSIDVTKLTFRRTAEHEVFPCSFTVGNDIQSGPLYCGDVAEFIATAEHSKTEGGKRVMGIVTVCSRCSRKLPRHVFAPE